MLLPRAFGRAAPPVVSPALLDRLLVLLACPSGAPAQGKLS